MSHKIAVAYTAKALGAEATIVIPDTTPQVKIQAIHDLGANIVTCEASERFKVAEEERQKRLAIMVPPYNDYKVMAGQGTAGLEIAHEGIDFDSVIVPVSGGGLISGGNMGLDDMKSLSWWF